MNFLSSVLLLLCYICLAAGQTSDGDVRLINGPSAAEGLLRVYYRGRLGSVCDDVNPPGTLQTLGQVACRNLKRSLVRVKGGSSGNTPTFLLDDTKCIGTETNLDQCAHGKWGSENCGAGEHVYVTCTDLPCDGGKKTCSQLCTNVNKTTYTCSCESGYRLAADGHGCEDINECLVDNGGCSHSCVNKIGSHDCTCPRYLYLSSDNATCTADGFTVDCSSSFGMTIKLDRKEFFFLPDSLTLTNTSCTSQSNSTHIWLYTDYNTCSTVRKVVGNEVIYSNAVLDSKTVIGGIRFFDSIKIPFQCRLSANQTISQGLTPVANKLIMRLDGTGRLIGSLELLDGNKDSSSPMLSKDIKQGEVVYAKLIPSINGLNFVPDYCDVLSSDRKASQRLITSKGKAANFITKILPSVHFRFSYPVFTFNSKDRDLTLQCQSSLTANSSIIAVANDSLIVTAQDIAAAASKKSSSASEPVAAIVDPNSGASLVCGPKGMTATLSPSVTIGLQLNDLQPLEQNCFGFYSTITNGNYVYYIPLTGCGAEVTKSGDQLSFTNSLVYSRNMTSKVKYFTEVILTHSCTYGLSDYFNSVGYIVRSNNYSFGAENKKQANFDINLNVFSDDKFKELLNNGGAISISEGKHLFGDIGVTSSDPNLQVALNECKVTPTNNVNDPNSHVVIKNGCKTAYGTRVFSPNRFSMLTRSFVDHRGKNVYLHCSVIVCGSNNLARCQRKCATTALPGDAIGRREVDTEPSPEELVNVSAGPFLVK